MIKTSNTHLPDLRALIGIGCFTVLALLLMSWDSYLYDLPHHHDVIWFYMCGKAWMHGLTPYIDFADSKGPLLWLIYGLGHLLSPRDYIGCYWLSCLLYTFIFYQCYLCALLYVKDRRLAFMAVLFSAVFFLSSLTHTEVRAEDYCYAFMMPVFYRFLRYTVTRENSREIVRKTAIILGISLGATLLIKYSCTLMMAVFIPYCCIVMPRRVNYPVWKALAWCAIAGIVTMLPVIVLLACQGALGACIQEYFLVTATTFGNLHGESIKFSSVMSVFLGAQVLIFNLGVILCVVIYGRSHRSGWKFITLALIWFMAIIMLNGTDRIYYNVLALFTVLAAGIIMRPAGRWLRGSVAVAIATVAVLAGLFITTDRNSLFTAENPDNATWYYYPMLMSQYEKPRVLYLNCHDHGESVPVMGLPACKYWSLQEGHSPEMVKEQVDAVMRFQADVVFLRFNDYPMIHMLEELGYHRYDFTDAGLGDKRWERYLMYSQNELVVPQPVQRKPIDILLKRNFLSIK